ncbi:DUF3188 domain-containing protein [Synechococcus sp. CCY9201]|jgi:hypothetical protein|uniref:DUF3188 domain-containing protein n=1 Tax=unclassified Synechococcus TaxID=2626047 RepID=UPI0018CF95C3|nr:MULTISPECIES: DUF3188 domain-containing protein [unclassified Synechococcus]MCT0223871.1 DUF3188 domain-containing protein [Synechococcus sp. CS-1328]MEA5472711.1 DUF3188 domain-containing protein [Synechococcus sp. CCY9201]QPN60924.1 DUF3188 domain-containing protein [Synechococcus sp. CBW1002]QPN67384.1 DUF3188 domain-containing protein [Synechococcus sp. CBW1006]CAK6702062.1 hypothetical protein IFHNHDMJ_03383 [Synechococcus sp. CBW1107]
MTLPPAGSPARTVRPLLALSSLLLILLALVALLLRQGADRMQAIPALLIGVGLQASSLVGRRRRRAQLLGDLRQDNG